jgi:hypothetical protein
MHLHMEGVSGMAGGARNDLSGDLVNTQLRRFAVLAVAMVAALAMSVTAAFAQYPPASAFGVSCTTAQPGGTSQCTVVGAAANERLTATASADGRVFDTQTFNANAEGEATFSVEIPTDVRGNVVVSVEGPESGSASDTITVAAAGDAGTPVTGGDAAAGDRLPFTGGNVTLLLLVAFALLGGGALAVRGRQASVDA